MATGLLFIDESGKEPHALARATEMPLVDRPLEQLCPGNAALQALMQDFR